MLYLDKNGGPAIARDYGIEKTSKSSKYVFFLDADDTIDPTMLECLYWALETNPDASFAYTSVVNFGEREFYWEKYLTIEHEKDDNLITVSAMVKKDDLLEVGCFGIKEKAMYEDWNLWLKLIRAGKKPLRVNAPLFWYRQTGTGELSRARKNSKEAMKYVNETAKDIKDDQVEVIQYPRYGDDFAMVNTYDMVLPDYKKDKRKTIEEHGTFIVKGTGEVYMYVGTGTKIPYDDLDINDTDFPDALQQAVDTKEDGSLYKISEIAIYDNRTASKQTDPVCKTIFMLCLSFSIVSERNCEKVRINNSLDIT